MFTNNCVLILFSLIILFLEEIFGVVIHLLLALVWMYGQNILYSDKYSHVVEIMELFCYGQGRPLHFPEVAWE